MLRSLKLSSCIALESLTFRINDWMTSYACSDDRLSPELTTAMSSISNILQTAPSTIHLSIGIRTLHLQKEDNRVWFWELMKQALQPIQTLQTLTIMLFEDRAAASKPDAWWTGPIVNSIVLPPSTSPSDFTIIGEMSGLFPNIRVHIVTFTWN